MANERQALINDAERAKATSLSAINKLIGSISRSATKLNESIHNAAVMCMVHSNDFGDATPAARLVDAMPKSHRRSLLVNWFAAFSPVTIGKDAKTDRMKAHLAGKEGDRKWLIGEAKATPFFAMPEAQNEPNVPTYKEIHDNVISYLDRTKKRAEKVENAEDRQRLEAELDRAKAAVAA